MNPAAATPTGLAADEAYEPRSRTSALDQSRLTHLMGYAATRASVALKKVFARHLGPLHLKAVEFSILVLVASNENVNQKQLGQALDVSPPNLAVTLDRMVERGWVERVRSTEDRRSQIVVLTKAGQQLVQRAEKIAATMENEALSVLSPAERLLLLELLLKVSQPRRRAEA